MKTFFDKSNQDELQQRLQRLNAETSCQWGKMTASQMLAHCTAALQMPVGDIQLKRTPLSLIGWMFKGMIVNGKPFTQNSPTAAELVVRDERDFRTESERFLQAFQKVAQGPGSITCFKHPFFGRMSTDDWGYLIYKHLDHHLQQFGV
jgi:Protein of unknown function (DUF1569)